MAKLPKQPPADDQQPFNTGPTEMPFLEAAEQNVGKEQPFLPLNEEIIPEVAQLKSELKSAVLQPTPVSAPHLPDNPYGQRKIGRYVVEQSLVKPTHMSEVYLAYDPEFKRQVVIKRLKVAHIEQAKQRFEQERHILAYLEGFNVVTVYDSVEDQGVPCLVMRYMEGGTLWDKVKTAPFTLADTQKLLTELLPTFERMAQLGIVHRDIKPQNILFDKEGRPFLADFGIAKDGLSSPQPFLTGPAMGTPEYMSPEQWRNEQVSPATDVYALGVMLYQLWTQKIPFVTEEQHAWNTIPNPCLIKPQLPAGCYPFLQRALAKNPAQRFQSVAELTAVLNQLHQPSWLVQNHHYLVYTFLVGCGLVWLWGVWQLLF